MEKIAVVFPGMGYTKDRPLLYYAGKMAKNSGYELVHIDFSGLEWSKDRLTDHAYLTKKLDECLRLTEEMLKDADISQDDEVLFISKSIGTVVAAAYAAKKSLNVRHICFSPLELIGSFIREESGILFYGDNDPFANFEVIEKIGAEKKLEMHRIEGGNHSLETGDILRDIDSLHGIMLRISDIISKRDIYHISVQGRDGSIKDLSEYRDKVLLIVNTATGCGFTPQYEALEGFYRTYKKDGFAVLDFPCNQFGKQAPGTASEIHNFCTAKYDISFEQFAKIDVNRKNETELFAYLKSKQGFHGFGDSPDADYMRKKLAKEVPGYEDTADIKWNFTKFLINRKGEVAARFEPTESMDTIEKAIKAEL